MPGTTRLHHIGIVVPDWQAAADYMAVFGHTEAHRGFVEAFSCWCLFCDAAPGQTTVELVIPEGGSLARFNKGAGGLHHHAFETPDLAALTADLAARGHAMLHEAPVKGAGNFICNFLSPMATRGPLVEFVQPL